MVSFVAARQLGMVGDRLRQRLKSRGESGEQKHTQHRQPNAQASLDPAPIKTWPELDEPQKKPKTAGHTARHHDQPQARAKYYARQRAQMAANRSSEHGREGQNDAQNDGELPRKSIQSNHLFLSRARALLASVNIASLPQIKQIALAMQPHVLLA